MNEWRKCGKIVNNDTRREAVGSMRKIQFVKEPGYLYDLFFLFSLYFNMQRWLKHIINYNKTAEDKEYFEKVLNPYLPISNELLVFFYLNDDNAIFLTQNYYKPYSKELLSGKYSLDFVLEKLSNYDEVIDNVIRFYFRDLSDEMFAECRRSLTALNELVKESRYNGDVKSSLLSLVINPQPVINKLKQELVKKNILLSKQYSLRFAELQKVQNEFDFDVLVEKLKSVRNQPIDIESFSEVQISWCLQSKNAVTWKLEDNIALMLLGIDYIDALIYFSDRSKLPDFEAFGNAMSEKNRIDILNLVHDREELSIKDIQQELCLTAPNAYYHLAIMIKTGLLKTRNDGRIVLYRVNTDYFTGLGELLLKYGKRLKEREQR